jgi:acetylornithine deacetylase/succinyl-diaminopimelate desuccinylase-like protein
MKFSDIKEQLPTFREAAADMRDILLANAVMIGEIPAPTFYEDQRVRFIEDRFSEAGLQNCSTDEVGNGFGILTGTTSERRFLLVAHADTVFSNKVDHTVSMWSDRMIGAGMGDNSLGLAALASLPLLLDKLGIRLKADLILMAAARSLGRGNLEGLRFFLDNNQQPIHAALCVEGVQLGRLSYTSIGMARGEITVTVPEEYDWTRFGAAGAIITLNDVINKINRIRLPKRPKTSIVLGSIEGGTSFNTIATQSLLRFEVRSESADVVKNILDEIHDRITEVSLDTSAEIKMEILARRAPGGIDFRHPLVHRSREVLKALHIEPRVAPSTSELSELIQHRIPAITLGLSSGAQLNLVNEEVMIEPTFNGLAQVIGMLVAMDEGLCDEH